MGPIGVLLIGGGLNFMLWMGSMLMGIFHGVSWAPVIFQVATVSGILWVCVFIAVVRSVCHGLK